MKDFSYVYILVSDTNPEHYYVGLTDDLNARLKKHNKGNVVHTSKYRPWSIKTALAFRDRQQAAAFEIYLKSASGRAFAKNRLLASEHRSFELRLGEPISTGSTSTGSDTGLWIASLRKYSSHPSPHEF